jgi:hypothetical protein
MPKVYYSELHYAPWDGFWQKFWKACQYRLCPRNMTGPTGNQIRIPRGH